MLDDCRNKCRKTHIGKTDIEHLVPEWVNEIFTCIGRKVTLNECDIGAILLVRHRDVKDLTAHIRIPALLEVTAKNTCEMLDENDLVHEREGAELVHAGDTFELAEVFDSDAVEDGEEHETVIYSCPNAFTQDNKRARLALCNSRDLMIACCTDPTHLDKTCKVGYHEARTLSYIPTHEEASDRHKDLAGDLHRMGRVIARTQHRPHLHQGCLLNTQ